jgi:HTH-type transcriptional regulator/antitoxin MqsA
MNISTTVCPVCEQGHLTAEVYVGEVQHNGSQLSVSGMERCRCDTCGADPVLVDQIKRNQIRIADARRACDGLLSADEIRHVRELMNISQAQAALILGGGANAFSKYERGEVAQSVAMDRLLRLVRDIPGAIHLLASYAGLSISAVLGSNEYIEVSAITAEVQRAEPKSISKQVVVSTGRYKLAA